MKTPVINSFDHFLLWEQASRDAILVKRVYIDMAGDLAAGVMLSQIIYWHLPNDEGKSRLKVEIEGEFFLVKGYGDWWEECRLTFKQARRAIEILQEKGLISIFTRKFAGAPRLHIRLEREAFLEELNRFALQGKSTCPTGQIHLTSRANPLALQGKSYKQTLQTDTTTDTTAAADTTSPTSKRQPKPKVPAAAVLDFEGSSLSPEAQTLAEKLNKAGLNRSDAERLATTKHEEAERQLQYLPFKKDLENQGAYLRAAIEGGYAPPKEYQQAQRAEAAKLTAQRQAEAKRQKEAEAEQQKARVQAATLAEIETLPDPQAQAFQAYFDQHRADALSTTLKLSPRMRQTLEQSYASSEKRVELYQRWRRTLQSR